MASIGDLYIGGLQSTKTSALNNVLQFKTAGPVALYTLTVHNYNATARMILAIDSPTIPIAGAVVPIWAFPIAASTATGPGVFAASWVNIPLKFVNGCWIVMSTVLTTPYTLTYAGATDGYIQGQAQTD